MTVFFGDGTSQTSAAGASKLVQTVTANSKTQYSFTSSSYVDTDVTVNITPTSSSNKVLISCTLATQCYATNSTSLGVRLLRGSTVIHDPVGDSTGPFEQAGYFRNGFNWIFNYLDSPNTTSAVTYKTMARIYNSGTGGTLRMQMTETGVSGVSYVHLMEISA